jgi:Protein of unknown function (DUF3616)
MMKSPHKRPNNSLNRLTLIIVIFFSTTAAWGEIANKIATLEISPATFIDSKNISGIALHDDFLILGSDEEAALQVLNKSGQNTFLSDKAQRIVLDNSEKEVDIEGIAAGKKYIYVIGSHSRKRLQVLEEKSSKKNHKRLAKIKIEPNREQLFRLELDVEGQLVTGSFKSLSLRDIIANHPVLSLFQSIPSKENGIDIEGIAVNEKTNEIYLGFRGPVLRGNFTPVLVLTLDDGKFKQKKLKRELRYVNIGGRGIRGLTRTGDQFLILGGPVGDEPTPYYLYSWDGKDMVPGKDRPKTSTHIKQLCEIPLPNSSAKAEGIEFLQQKEGKVHVLIVYDGVQNGGGTVFSCPL